MYFIHYIARKSNYHRVWRFLKQLLYISFFPQLIAEPKKNIQQRSRGFRCKIPGSFYIKRVAGKMAAE